MTGLLHALGVMVAIVLGVGGVLFAGGVLSAALETKRERAMGLEPSRPADDLRAKRRVRGDGILGSGRIWWRQLRTNVPQCWCGYGTLVFYPRNGVGPYGQAGYGCTAYENDHPGAARLHDHPDLGGYGRTGNDGMAVKRAAS